MRDASKKISDIFTATQHVLGPGAWKRMLDMCGHGIDAELFVERISELQKDHLIPDFLPELTMVEWTYHAVCQTKIKLPNRVEKYVLNPTLEAIQCRWRLSFLLGDVREITK